MTAFVIAEETALQPSVRALVADLNDHLRPLSPPEFQFQLTAEQMAEPGVTLFVVRDGEGTAIGMGALKAHDAEFGEVKRMFSAPTRRGQGIGRQVLGAVEAKARSLGLKRLALETGATSGFEPAWALYERAGFRPCGAFLDYPDSGFSRFYEKNLI
ncbi:N-acetyltransferase [Aureimonas endophytica]|uniref:N-acetyltransferase n=1 Tax=Aureimonas endophytica TaxID=2027858 RepID=A0A917E1C6_9HYPH|nr:GNAT family N-acetyltransferase [Aureimonas endophytica]GGD88398.1 N-acetyltransferase [Aureimonas endophytica]